MKTSGENWTTVIFVIAGLGVLCAVSFRIKAAHDNQLQHEQLNAWQAEQQRKNDFSNSIDPELLRRIAEQMKADKAESDRLKREDEEAIRSLAVQETRSFEQAPISENKNKEIEDLKRNVEELQEQQTQQQMDLEDANRRADAAEADAIDESFHN